MKLTRVRFLVWVFMILAGQTINAQWVPTGGPREGWMLSLTTGAGAAGDTILYAAGGVGCVFRSTNQGTNWTEIEGGTWWTIP
jgi:hypothetical protein